MFEPHKGHTVCKIDEAANVLRNKMDDVAKTGIDLIFLNCCYIY